MALFCVARKPVLVQLLTRHVKVNYYQFHTLKNLDKNRIFSRTIPTKFVSPTRNYFWIFKKRTKREIILADKAEENYELIYRFPADNYFLGFQHIGFYCIVTAFVISIFRFCNTPIKKHERISEERFKIRMPKEENEALLLLGAFSLVFFVIHLFYNRLPMRIYCYPQRQKYLFYYYGSIPNQIKVQEIKVGQLKHKPTEGSIIPWSEKTYECEETGQKFLLFEDHFRRPVDLHVMLGWYKDPDINYDYNEPEELKKSDDKKQ